MISLKDIESEDQSLVLFSHTINSANTVPTFPYEKSANLCKLRSKGLDLLLFCEKLGIFLTQDDIVTPLSDYYCQVK